MFSHDWVGNVDLDDQEESIPNPAGLETDASRFSSESLAEQVIDESRISNPSGLEIERPEISTLQLSDSQIKALRRARREARNVLDHEIESMTNLSNHGLQTARLSILLFGLFLSLVSIASQYSSNGVTKILNNLDHRISIALLFFGSFFTGLVGYGILDIDFGTKSSSLEDYRNNKFNEDEFLLSILNGYENWIEHAQRINKINSWLLLGSQIFLILALVLLVYDVLM